LCFFLRLRRSQRRLKIPRGGILNCRPYLFSASFDPTGKEVIVDRSAADPQAAAQQQQFVIDRIEFLGNRRVRSDTLKARIFSRDGDVYNEETLRRDFKRFGTRNSSRT